MITVGLIGAGFMGTTHAAAYESLSNVSVKYIVDKVEERSNKLAARLSAISLTKLGPVLSDPEIDLIDITLPTPLHHEIAIKALNAGKHVITEKPIALSRLAAKEMIDAAVSNNKYLMIAHVVRFMPEYSKINGIIKEGLLGKPQLAHAYRLSNMPQWSSWFKDPAKTGGAVLDLQIHDIDFLNWIFGEPKSVYSRGKKDNNGGWNSVLTIIEYKNGSASLESSFLMPKDYPFTCGVRVHCERGDIEYYFRASGASLEQGLTDSFLLIHEDGKPNQKISVKQSNGYMNEIKYFIDCVEKNETPLIVSAEDAFLSLDTALSTRESLETGQKIIIRKQVVE